jgi:hypothetical protein
MSIEIGYENLNLHRKALFATTWGDWEWQWGGYDSPADRVPTWAIADNGMDDDGPDVLAAGGGFRLNNDDGPGLAVDRSHPDPQGRTHPVGSVISRRDEYLRPEEGLTLEVSVRIRPPTQVSPETGHAGFVILYRRSDGACFGIHLDQSAVRGGGYGRWVNQGPTKAFKTTDKVHKYRMAIKGIGLNWSCYIDGVHAFDAVANTYRVTSLRAEDKFPTIIIGGEKGNRTTSYTRMRARYRRGAFAPGAEIGVPHLPRVPHPLPIIPQWRELVAAKVFHYPPSRPLSPLPTEWISAKPESYRTTAVSLAPPCTDKGDLTVEWTLAVHPDCEWRGYLALLRDGMGSWSIYWSPDRVELGVGLKHTGWEGYHDVPIGIRPVYLNALNEHIYRFVRPANSYYAHLYIDDNQVPALFDQRGDASQGGLLDAAPPALRMGDTGNNFGKGRVMLKRLRWSNPAHAPGGNL